MEWFSGAWFERTKTQKPAPQPKKAWIFRGKTCSANTRSEARAIFKSRLKLDRLPPGETPQEIK